MTMMRLVGVALAAGVFLTSCASDSGSSSSAETAPIGAETAVPGPEHAVIVYLTMPEVDEVFALEEALEERIVDADVGEYDGNEIAVDGSEAVLYAYGPDADPLWEVMEPIIRDSSPNAGSYVIKRYGEASDPAAREVRIDL